MTRKSVKYVTCILGALFLAAAMHGQQQCTAADGGSCRQIGSKTTNGCSIPITGLIALQAILATTDPAAALAARCTDPNNPACGSYTSFSNYPTLGPLN